jgi:hypothetical protein
MIESFHYYFWREDRLREVSYVVTTILGIICASVASTVLHVPERRVSVGLIVFLILSNLTVAFIYCMRRARILDLIRIQAEQLKQIPPLGAVSGYSEFSWKWPFEIEPILRPPSRPVIVGGLVAIAVLVSAPKLSVRIIQAAIVDPHLERAVASVKPDEAASLPSDQLKARFQTISSIATTYTDRRIRANPEVVSRSIDNLQDTLKSTKASDDVRRSGAAAFVALAAYATYNNVLLSVNVPTVLLPHGETGNSLVSQVPLKNGAIWWQGSAEGNTIFAMPNGAGPVFPILNSRVVFNGIGFNGFGLGRAFVGTDGQSQVAVMNAKIEGAVQKLDSIVWLDIEFRGSRIVYEGGPLYLGKVKFVNCQFVFGDDPESKRVLDEIVQVHGEQVSLVSGF